MSSDKKAILTLTTRQDGEIVSEYRLERKKWTPRTKAILVFSFALLGWLLYIPWPQLGPDCLHRNRHHHHSGGGGKHGSHAAKCPAQPAARNIGIDWNPLTDDLYAQLAARRLSQAVQIKTESFDDLPMDPTDSGWDKHYAFSHMLETEFPKIYNALDHSAINTHGHLFEWIGKDKSLKPVVLMAHIDTVPVLPATLAQWTYPPFEGKISVNGTKHTPGTWIWGRGASDCKNSVMGILGSVERLVTEGYTPDRTVILAFGFDEEVSIHLIGTKCRVSLPRNSD